MIHTHLKPISAGDGRAQLVINDAMTSTLVPQLLDAEDFLDRLAARLLPAPADLSALVSGPSDYDLNPSMRQPAHDGLIPAAVLVPILARRPLAVLLTERTAHLSAHAGQIAFPGGKIDPEDDGPCAAALREAREEIGLEPRFVTPLGYLEPYRTGTGFIITPVVARVDPGYALKPDPAEVEDVFDVPLAFLMDEANHKIDSREWKGGARQFYAMPYEQRYIWGATAGIIKALHRRLLTA